MNGQLDLDTSAVGLGPNEAGIDQTHFAEALELLETERQELARLERGGHPDTRRLQVALAVAAKVDGRLLRDALCNVDLIPNAVHAQVGRVGWRRCTAARTLFKQAGL